MVKEYDELIEKYFEYFNLDDHTTDEAKKIKNELEELADPKILLDHQVIAKLDQVTDCAKLEKYSNFFGGPFQTGDILPLPEEGFNHIIVDKCEKLLNPPKTHGRGIGPHRTPRTHGRRYNIPYKTYGRSSHKRTPRSYRGRDPPHSIASRGGRRRRTKKRTTKRKIKKKRKRTKKN